MKKAFLVLVFLAVCGNAYSAELLIQAKPHWLDSLTEKEVAGMDESTRQSYEARSKVGDVIAVRPDGWTWGKEEGLPNYIVVKVPMTVEEAQKYEEQLLETVQHETVVDGKAETITAQVLKRKRKYAIPEVYVSTAKTADKTDVSIASKDVTAFKSAITEKVGLAKEIKPPVKDTIKTDLHSFYKKHFQKYVAVAQTFWNENAWAATQLKKTICPSGCDYTALETCMNANEQNLVTADKYFDVEISGSWSSADTTAVVIHNYTTDATRYINIYTTGNARHAGVYSTSKYRLEMGENITAISPTANDIYLTIDGLLIKTRPQDWNNRGSGISSNKKPQWIIKNNIIWGADRTTQDYLRGGVGIGGGNEEVGGSFIVYNNIVYGFKRYNASADEGIGIKLTTYGATYLVYGNTVYNCDYGIVQGNTSTGTVKNNIVQASVSTDYSIEDTVATNIDDDGSGDITATIEFTSLTAGSEDFHLISEDTEAIDAGTDLGSPYNVDIDGVTRSGTWDIGADEYVSAARRRNMLIQ